MHLANAAPKRSIYAISWAAAAQPIAFTPHLSPGKRIMQPLEYRHVYPYRC